jgi:hypothetical protein
LQDTHKELVVKQDQNGDDHVDDDDDDAEGDDGTRQ